MAVDDQRNVLALREVEQFDSAGDGARWIEFQWRIFSIWSECAGLGDGVDGEEDRAQVRQSHQYRLVAGRVARRRDDRQARQNLGVAID